MKYLFHFKRLFILLSHQIRKTGCSWDQWSKFPRWSKICHLPVESTGKSYLGGPKRVTFCYLDALRFFIAAQWRIVMPKVWVSIGLYLSGVPDLWDHNKILSGGDLSHYQVPHCIRVSFYFVWFVFIHHNLNFILNYVLIVTFWIFTYHKIWILLIIYCFIWNYWVIYFLTCLEVFWSVVS